MGSVQHDVREKGDKELDVSKGGWGLPKVVMFAAERSMSVVAPKFADMMREEVMISCHFPRLAHPGSPIMCWKPSFSHILGPSTTIWLDGKGRCPPRGPLPAALRCRIPLSSCGVWCSGVLGKSILTGSDFRGPTGIKSAPFRIPRFHAPCDDPDAPPTRYLPV